MKKSTRYSKANLQRLSHKKGLLCGIIAVGAIVLVTILLFLGVTDAWSLSLSDTLYDIRPSTENIVVVAIDDPSLQEVGRWPWNRTVFADIISKLDDANVIGFDLSFFEESTIADDNTFAQAINDSTADFVLVSEFVFAQETLYLEPVFKTKAGKGHANIFPDSDGIVRSLPSQIEDSSSFSSAVAQRAVDIPLIVPQVMMVTFYDAPPIVSFADVLEGRTEESFDDAIVLIGVTAPDFHDDHLVAVSKQMKMPGVVIHANAIETMLRQDFLRRQSMNAVWFFIAILAIIIAALFWRFSAVIAASASLLLLIAYVVFAFTQFGQNVVFDLLHPVLSGLLTAVGSTVVLYFTEAAQKKQVSSIFGKYVSKEVAAEIFDAMKHGKEVRLGGEKREITILFSDIRGFTSMSEKLTPEQLVHVLNEYLSAMTKVIAKHTGVVDKFIGDAIMAFWNAPIAQEDHAVNAVKAGIDMAEELDKLCSKWKSEGLPEMRIGIGVNTGPAVAGNIGSTDRLSYTIMGDAVNLGSRLEGLTKFYGVTFIVSEATYTLIKGKILCRKLDLVRVKGKNKPITIYEVLGEKISKEHEDVVNTYEKAFQLYLDGEFAEAKRVFAQANTMKEDKASKLMIERCTAYQKTPPKQWDGVFEMTTK